MSLCQDTEKVLPAWAAPLGSTASPLSPVVLALGTGHPVPEERCSRRSNSTRSLTGKRLWLQRGGLLWDTCTAHRGPVAGVGEAHAGHGLPGG